MITRKDVHSDLPPYKYCMECGANHDIKTVYCTNRGHYRELTYCKPCWQKIMDMVWSKY